MKKAEAPASKWCTPEGSLIACTEKNKVMAENLEEIKGYLQDAIDDAVLMGCSRSFFSQGLFGLDPQSAFPISRAKSSGRRRK